MLVREYEEETSEGLKYLKSKTREKNLKEILKLLTEEGLEKYKETEGKAERKQRYKELEVVLTSIEIVLRTLIEELEKRVSTVEYKGVKEDKELLKEYYSVLKQMEYIKASS